MTDDLENLQNPTSKAGAGEPGGNLGRMLDEIGFGIFTHSADPAANYWSPGMYRILGLDPAAYKPGPETITGLVIAEDKPRLRSLQKSIMSGPGDYHLTFRVELAEVGIKHLQLHVLVEYDQSGSSLVQLGVLQEVTAEAAVERQHDQLRQDHFHLLTENLPGVVYLCKNDERWTMLFLNEAVKELTGYPREEFLKNRISFADVIHPEDVSAVYSDVHRALETGSHYQLQYRIVRPDGTVRWVEEMGDALRCDGQVLFLEGYISDVTERRQSQQQLVDSEAMLRTLSDATFECIFLSEQGVCIGQNTTAEQTFGYSLAEALGRMGTDWIAPEYRDRVMQNMLKGTQDPYTAVALRKDGTTFPCEIQGRMTDHRGRRVRVTSLRDITKRKLAEDALEESRERYELAVQGAQLGAWDLNIVTGEMQIDQRCHEMLGYQVGDVKPVIESWYELIHPEDLSRVQDIVQSHLRGETEFFEAEYRLQRQ